MAEPQDRPSTSGVLVYPKLPVPKDQSREPGEKKKMRAAGGNKKLWIAAAIGGVVFGGAIGYVVKPSHAAEVEKAKTDAAAAQKAAASEKSRADDLDKQLTDAKKANDDLQAQLKETSEKAADAEKKADEALKAKLSGAIDKSQGDVSTEGNEIHLKLVDKVLFALGDDQLTDKGKQVLDKVAVALKEVPDKYIWVQGHTDDTPIAPLPAKKPDPKEKKPPKGQKPEPPPKPMTNWELSANRALNVVHYLQDVDKIDPTRLAAIAFGQYHPISYRNKAANRRIEIVLYPKPKLVKK